MMKKGIKNSRRPGRQRSAMTLRVASGQKGVSLIITFFVMIIILAIVVSISVLLYSEEKIIKNVGDSMVSFYAADSGIEKVLFYDRQVLSGSKRGLCSIPDNCIPDNTWSPDHSIFCSGEGNSPPIMQSGSPGGCNKCTDCTVNFYTTFDDRTYNVTAKVYPDADPNFSRFEITSRGSFKGSQRQIQTLTVTEDSK